MTTRDAPRTHAFSQLLQALKFELRRGCPSITMASDRITISAGGKDFVTSLSTLKSSGAGYF